jgi:hypothetical protein
VQPFNKVLPSALFFTLHALFWWSHFLYRANGVLQKFSESVGRPWPFRSSPCVLAIGRVGRCLKLMAQHLQSPWAAITSQLDPMHKVCLAQASEGVGQGLQSSSSRASVSPPVSGAYPMVISNMVPSWFLCLSTNFSAPGWECLHITRVNERERERERETEREKREHYYVHWFTWFMRHSLIVYLKHSFLKGGCSCREQNSSWLSSFRTQSMPFVQGPPGQRYVGGRSLEVFFPLGVDWRTSDLEVRTAHLY